jgi:hypothetical protein
MTSLVALATNLKRSSVDLNARSALLIGHSPHDCCSGGDIYHRHRTGAESSFE